MNPTIIETDRRTYITMLTNMKGTAFVITKYYNDIGFIYQEINMLTTLKIWAKDGMDFNKIMNKYSK